MKTYNFSKTAKSAERELAIMLFYRFSCLKISNNNFLKNKNPPVF